MFRLVGLVVVVLSANTLADTPAKPKPAPTAPAAKSPKPAAESKSPLRVTRILGESQQAVLYDKIRKAHVMVEVGTQIAGYTVIEIDDDTVTLGASGKQLVLAAPAPLAKEEPAPTPAPAPPVVKAEPAKPAPAPSEEPAPAGTDGEPGAAPVDPYADDLGRDTPTANTPPAAPTPAAPSNEPAAPAAPASGPAAPPASGPAAPASGPAAPPASGPAAPASGPAAPASGPAAPPASGPAAPPASGPAAPPASGPAAPPASGPAAPPASGPAAPPASGPAAPPASGPAAPSLIELTISRTDVNAALLDFGALAGSIHGAFTPTGVRIERVADGSLFARAGLRAGDVVATIDGKPLRTLDDAADLYARAEALRAVTVQVVRGGRTITLKLAIR